MNFLKTFWLWLRSFFIRKEMHRSVQEKKKRKKQKFWWDSSNGTYRRRSPKIGRNAPCPCGTMREEPCDITKCKNYKRCCAEDK